MATLGAAHTLGAVDTRGVGIGMVAATRTDGSVAAPTPDRAHGADASVTVALAPTRAVVPGQPEEAWLIRFIVTPHLTLATAADVTWGGISAL